MKFLHTSDWHVGKVLKGHSRLEEQKDVLAEVVQIAQDNEVDAVLVAGDLYESAMPGAQAQQLVVRTLLELRRAGIDVVAIAGNHDHAATFDAYRPLMAASGITLIGNARGAGDGGVVDIIARSTGEKVRVVALPFISQRYAVRAAEIVTQSPAESAGSYEQLIRDLLTSLSKGFASDAVNLIMAHLTVAGAVFGGGERAGQSIFEYYVPATAFPANAHYAALGHFHRRQVLPAPCPVHYCGSPLALDFGEQDNQPVVLVVEAVVGEPARIIEEVPILSGRRLRTVRGTVVELATRADTFGEDFLRVFIREPARAALQEEVRELLPNALEIVIDPEFARQPNSARPDSGGMDHSPAELFHEYCVVQGIVDEGVEKLFAELHDQVTTIE